MITVTILIGIDIDQLPEKIIKTLEEADGHRPSEEELREIYEAHRELKQNVQKLKQEMKENVQKWGILSAKLKTDEDANTLDLVTDLMQSCEIPCDEGNCYCYGWRLENIVLFFEEIQQEIKQTLSSCRGRWCIS